jgi:4-amino-4-deoxy-L-arabinose transferase-like glycosyltransferase
MGLLLGLLILTYYPFLFLPLFIAGFWLFEQRRRSHLLVLILCCVLPLSLWIARNGIIAGKFALIEGRRSGICWYVRGEQAEKATGLEPFRCLWSEYVSRDWSGRSDACSFNAVWHARWPEGQDRARADDIADAGREGQAKIRSHVLSYLWFSVFEVLEFHIPFVGGGWSHLFNMYASLTGAIMYVGCLFGLTRLRRKHLILLVIVGYTVAVFCLTDATPRYAVPILFCYSAIAGIGYDRLLTFLRIP